jgi:hypothetical protein
MIAAVKGWQAVLSALLYLSPVEAHAADDLGGAARELARKTAALAGRGESVAITWRNLSSLGPSDLAQARGAFEAALRESGARTGDTAVAVEARVTLSESQSQYLLVEEAHKGDERQTLIASWKRSPGAAAIAGGGAVIERTFLWEQSAPILDAAVLPNALLVLSPATLTLYARGASGLREFASVPVNPARPWPRDPRARLLVNGTAIRAFLPGALCTGSLEPALALDCRPSDEPWPFEAGRAIALAAFAPGRNYFDGRVVAQNGARKSVAPFYSAAAFEQQGSQFWVLLTTVDGRTQIVDAAFESAGAVAGWGSDIAAISAPCAPGGLILAARPGDAREPDAIRAYRMLNRTPVALSTPVDFAGPVTALWSAGASAIAVARDPATFRYSAFQLTVACHE